MMARVTLRRMWCAVVVATLGVGVVASSAMALEPLTIRRFALLVGSNQGGDGRASLRFAQSDARALAQVLEELGGVHHDDTLTLLDPTVDDISNALTRLQQRLASNPSARQRRELVFYYSGHSDEEGLLLGEQRFEYKALRRALAELSAEVRIAILDSCASGALTRQKGGQRRPPFLVDAANKTSGHAFLTSSSAREAAQESDRIGASFFTHYLISGLRGAADVSGDGRVTLIEAYQFAFNETLARTEKTRSGAQHPNYDIQLAGSGELVMTDLRATSANLTIDEKLDGRVFVRDERGRLVVELNKLAGRNVTLALAPGRYDVTLERRGQVRSGQLAVRVSANNVVTDRHLTAVEVEIAHARGNGTAEHGVRLPYAWTLLPGIGTEIPAQWGRVVKQVSVNLLYGASDEVDGLEVGTLNHVLGPLHGFEMGLIGNIVGGPAHDAVQIGGMFNVGLGAFNGVQGSGFVNAIRGSMGGVQATGMANLTTGPVRAGIQATAGINVAGGVVSGVQAAGVANLSTAQIVGLQASAFANYAHGAVTGLQVSGGLNVGTHLDGAQIGIVNIGSSIKGTQVGILNVASGEVDGAQIGIVNVSDRYAAGGPVGLLSLVRQGQHHIDVWANTDFDANVSVKLGSRRVYGMWSFRYKSPGYNPGRTALGFGMGSSWQISRLFIATDFSAYWLTHHRASGLDRLDLTDTKRGPGGVYTEARLLFGARALEHVGAFVGITAALHGIFEERADRPYMAARTRIEWGSVGAHSGLWRLWPGLVAGVQL